MACDRTMSGRARTVLVFGENKTAVLSTVIARICRVGRGRPVKFTGSVLFDVATAGRIRQVVVPLVDRILAGLGLSRSGFEIAIANIAGASVADLTARVSGFSADVPVLLSLLSASLQMPVPQDLVSTGHVASPDGDIRAVRAIPAKLAAARADGSIRRFVHPPLDRDTSLEVLSPHECEQATKALAGSPDRLQTVRVEDVAELVQATFDDEVAVLASLRQDFFEPVSPHVSNSDPVGRVVRHLNTENEDRFWPALERQLLAGQRKRARSLLRARIAFHLRHRTYPEGCGLRLLQLVQSLPPAIRRLRRLFPLLPMRSCIEIGQQATERDQDDVRCLIDASSGRNLRPKVVAGSSTCKSDSGGADGAALDAVLSEIDTTNLAHSTGLPIDSARARYILDAVTVASYEEFLDCISAFHLHLLRHVRRVATSEHTEAFDAEAVALLERAFARRGGLEAAIVEAQEGPKGGMRLILDILTEQFKTEEKAKHVSRVLKEALDPLDWPARVRLMAALLQRLGPALPHDLRSAPPERFARRWEELVQAYVDSLDQIQQVLRTF